MRNSPRFRHYRWIQDGTCSKETHFEVSVFVSYNSNVKIMITFSIKGEKCKTQSG